jgi:RHS repeat-associated protein
LPTNFKTYQDFNYDDWGNIKFKTGVGNYTYYATKPHQLNEVKSASGAQLYKFFYDANGNSKTDGARTFTYGSYDKPTLITKAGSSSSMKYGPERELIFKTDTYVENGKNVTYQTTYLGNYEKVYRTGGAGTLTEHKFYVGDIVYTQRSNGSTDTFYLHKDHQGSVIATTNASGAVVSQAIYDPWGKRTAVYLHSTLASFTTSEPTDRGYTGHKHIKDLDIIHMGGRIYDPTLGRFLQADPLIQAPTDSQSYNRYAYVRNNPMSMTDPTGYSWLSKAWDKIKPYVGAIAGIVVAIYCPACGATMWNAAMTGAAIGAGSAAINGGNIWKGAFTGALAGAAFQQIGANFNGKEGSGFFAEGGLGHIATHGVTGGVMSVLQGGKFGHGFLAAGLTKALNINKMIGTAAKDAGLRVAVAAVVGGTISKVTGGKFANGAITAAFAQAFNGEQEAKNHEQQKMFNAKVKAGLDEIFEVGFDLDKGLMGKIMASKDGFTVGTDSTGNISISGGGGSMSIGEGMLDGSVAKAFKMISISVSVDSIGNLSVGGQVNYGNGYVGVDLQMAPQLYLRRTILGQRIIGYGSMSKTREALCAEGLGGC